MTTIRYDVEWSTSSGGLGISTFHLDAGGQPQAQAFATAVRTFFSSIANFLPSDVSISFPGEASHINTSDGELIGVFAVTPGASVVGASVGGYAAPSGARVRWVTNNIRRGRRVNGTTFIVPLAGASYENDGTIIPGTVTAIASAANTLRTSGGYNMVVYSRPTSPGSGDGANSTITGASVPDRAAVLRSRRD